jgi:hypothetical protein
MKAFPKYPKPPSIWASVYQTGRAQPRAGFGPWTTGAWGQLAGGWKGDAEVRTPQIERAKSRALDYAAAYGANVDFQGARRSGAPTLPGPGAMNKGAAGAHAMGSGSDLGPVAGRAAGTPVLSTSRAGARASRQLTQKINSDIEKFDMEIEPPAWADSDDPAKLPLLGAKQTGSRANRRNAGARMTGIDRSDWTV